MRQQHETDVRQWRHGPPSLATAGPLPGCGGAVGSPPPRIFGDVFFFPSLFLKKEEKEAEESEALGSGNET